MKKFSIFFVFLTGCMAQPIYDASYPMLVDPKLPVKDVYNIELIFTDKQSIKHICDHDLAVACAMPTIDPCVLLMNKENYLYYIVHEIHHCTNGFWH